MGFSTQITIILTASETTSPIIPIAGFSHGAIRLPSTATATSLTFWVSEDGLPTTFSQAYDAFGVAISLTVAASRGERLPTDLFVHRFLRIKADAVPASGAEVQIALGD